MSAYWPQMAALLAGGLVASVGPMIFARTARGRALLVRTKTPALSAFVVVALGLGAGAGYWMVGRLLDAARGAPVTPRPLLLLGVGLGLGLALSVPGVVISWSEARRTAEKKRKRRERAPTKDDRRAFAADLARQIEELSHPPREVRTSIGGNGGTVLELDGDFTAKEGERLTRALQADLRELGFKRVEGTGSGGEWWSRV